MTGQSIRLAARETYKKKGAQTIKDFDPGSDRLVIQVEDFGLDDLPDIGISKNKKMFKDFQRRDIDFIYRVNKKDGYILFNQNGVEPGLGDRGGVVAVIKTSAQFDHSQFTADLVEMI